MTPGIPILCYHQIVPDDFDYTSIPPGNRPYALQRSRFIQQVEYLAKNQFKSLTIVEYLNLMNQGKKLPNKSVIISFDDGNKSDYDEVFPIMQKYQLKAVFFIIVDQVETNGYLNWSEINDMAKVGMEIGSHTMTHPFLHKLSEHDVKQEFEQSKLQLEKKIEQQVTTIAIPRGFDHDKQSQIALSCGYSAVCTSHVGLNNLAADRMALKRIGIRQGYSLNDFSNIVSCNQLKITRLILEYHMKKIIKQILGTRLWFVFQKPLLRFIKYA